MPVQIGTAIISGTMGYNRLQVQSPILPPGTSVTSTTKGLLNGPGQNNCFLNCAVQVSLLLPQSSINFEHFFFCVDLK